MNQYKGDKSKLLKKSLLRATTNILNNGVVEGTQNLQSDFFNALKEWKTLQGQYTTLKMKAARLSEIKITQNNEPISQENENIDNKTDKRDTDRASVMATLTWAEILETAHRKADEDYNLFRDDLKKLEIARQQPAILVAEDELANSTGLSTNDLLYYTLHTPSFGYFSALKLALDKIVLEIQSSFARRLSGNLGNEIIGLHLGLKPSLWVEDMFKVFGLAKTIGMGVYYPSYVDLEELVFQSTPVIEIKNHKEVFNSVNPAGRDTNKTKNIRLKESGEVMAQTYALDLPYHLSKLAALFSTIPFNPDKSYSGLFAPAQYTDIQLLIHFAAALSKNIDYDDFMENEALFQQGERFNLLVGAVNEAIVLLKKSMVGLAFKSGSSLAGVGSVPVHNLPGGPKKGPVLYKKNVNGNYVEMTYVPDEVLHVLRSFVIDNLPQFIKRTAFMNLDGSGASTMLKRREMDTPLGQLLNFSAQAIRDFKTLTNNLRGMGIFDESSIQMNLVQSEYVGSLGSIQMVYAQLMVAANCIYATRIRDESQFSSGLVLSRAMAIDKDSGTPIYNSSFDIVPGYLFFIMLGDLEPQTDFVARRDVVKNIPYIGTGEFFEKVPIRVSFFNILGSYMKCVPTFKTSKTAAFVPTFSKVLTAKKKKEIWQQETYLLSSVSKNRFRVYDG